jgi:hypothetical protein
LEDELEARAMDVHRESEASKALHAELERSQRESAASQAALTEASRELRTARERLLAAERKLVAEEQAWRERMSAAESVAETMRSELAAAKVQSAKVQQRARMEYDEKLAEITMQIGKSQSGQGGNAMRRQIFSLKVRPGGGW